MLGSGCLALILAYLPEALQNYTGVHNWKSQHNFLFRNTPAEASLIRSGLRHGWVNLPLP